MTTKIKAGVIGDGVVGTTQIADDAISSAKIADDAVSQAKIADDAVGADQLASSAVVTASIVDDAITSAKIADNPAFSGTGSITLPAGTTAQRPGSPVNGMIRYNTTLEYVEYYNGQWRATSDTGV